MEVLEFPINEHDPILIGYTLILSVLLGSVAISYPLWFILHRLLAPLDNVLLKEPYFQKSEQINCLVWPLSYWKTMIYSLLIAAPKASKRKRFKGLAEVPEVGKVTKFLAKTHIFMSCLAGVMLAVFLSYSCFFLYIYPILSD